MTFFFTSASVSDRNMALPSDLLILAMPSMPGRRMHALLSGSSICGSTSVSPYTELNLCTISLHCSSMGI